MKLNAKTIHEAQGVSGAVAFPKYDRSKLTAGIVHFGVGGFHRAHQAIYLDELMNAGKAHDFAIVGVGVLPQDEKMRDALRSQDCLYTLTQKAPDGREKVRIIGSIIDYLFAPDDPLRVTEKMADPATKIVSLTITEGGYENPKSAVFGHIYEALKLRKERGIKPFTVMSCDNIQGNGKVCREAVLVRARLAENENEDVGGRETLEWIEREVPFPSSMVDRITPQTTSGDIIVLKEKYGVEDAWPVVTEDFLQWVLEDDFPAGRPPYDDAGVQLVGDVIPYELMKLRLLNASHQGIAYFGHLLGYEFVDEAASDPLMKRFLAAYMDGEGTPTLRPLPGIDLPLYKETLLERFANAAIKDTVARLAAESSDRIPKWLVPVIDERLAQGGEVPLSAAIVASWARYAEGIDESGAAIEVVDNAKEQVIKAAAAQKDDPLAFVKQENFFSQLASDERFTKPYLAALESLHKNGARKTLELLLGGEGDVANYKKELLK
jgi:mannitol 2-dehydrogenase